MSRSRRPWTWLAVGLWAVVRRALLSLPVLWVRVGLRLSVGKPDTLLA